MGKKLACLVTNVRDEEIIFPHWIKHYARYFEPCDVYVNDDGSTDATVELAVAAGCHVTAIPQNRSMSSHRDKQGITAIASNTTNVINELLQQYECALFMEVDDLMVCADGSPLKGFLESFVANKEPFYTSRCVSVTHVVGDEPALDVNVPWLRQRSNFLHIPKFDNPLLWKVAPDWSNGFHKAYGKKPKSDGMLIAFDTHHIDFDMCNARHTSRVAHNVSENVSRLVDGPLRDFFRRKCREGHGLYERPSFIEVPECVKDLIP